MRLVTLYQIKLGHPNITDMAQKKFNVDKEVIEKFEALANFFAEEGAIAQDKHGRARSTSEAFAHMVSGMYEGVIVKREATAEKKRNAEINVRRAEKAEGRVEEAREGIKKLCAINKKADEKHTFYITPNFIKKQLGLGHARVARKALEDKAIAKLVEDTNREVLGYPTFLNSEPTKKQEGYEAYQEAKKHNLRFRSKFYDKTEEGVLSFIAKKL